MPRKEDRSAKLRNDMVDSIKNRFVRCLSDELVEDAFRAIPRENFVPGRSLNQIYKSATLVTRANREGFATVSSTAPQMMAVMLEQLRAGRGDNILEIGTGTGYNAALLAHIVGPKGHVTTLDFNERVVKSVRNRVHLEKNANITVILGDGARGYFENAPYDGIIATASPFDVPPQWIAQMKPDARLVVPLTIRNWFQRSIAFECDHQSLVSTSVRAAGFIPMKGILEPPVSSFSGGPIVGLNVALYDTTRLPVELPDLLANGSIFLNEIGTNCPIASITDLSNWILLREPGLARVSLADTERASQHRWSHLLAEFQQTEALGVMHRDSIAILLFARYCLASRRLFRPTIAHCGSNGSARNRLTKLILDWYDNGMPISQPRSVIVRAKTLQCDESDNLVIPKLWNEFVIEAF